MATTNSEKSGTARELTLDPDDWGAFRALAHRMVDDMLDHLAGLREQPVWQPLPAEVREALHEPLPRQGCGDEAAYRAFREHVLPYSTGNRHPRFWGWVQGNGTPLGMMADMLAAGMNPHMAGFQQAPRLVEEQVIAWLRELMEFPPAASGVLALGGTMANVLALAVARHARAGFDVRAGGIQGAERPRLLVYASSETHGWAQKGVELLGLGSSGLCLVPVDAQYRLDVAVLRAQLAEDRQRGLRPFCVIGNAGTVNTGAIDDLGALAALCREQGLWFHVDGAFGALAKLSPRLRPLLAGLSAADSVAFDLHKWGYLPFDVACVLVRDAAAHLATFALTPSYLGLAERGLTAGGFPFSDRGLDLTRGFRALKVWLSLKAHGVDTFARLIEQNVAQAHYLAERVQAHPSLQLLAPVSLNVVCFRYAPPGLREQDRNAVNQELLLRLQESGLAVPSSAQLGGRFALRCAIVNHRSQRTDFDLLLDAVLRIGRDLAPTSGSSH